jgi:bile acid-coenzyme A ligase
VSEARTPFGVAVARLAAAAPDRPAITHEDRTITRGELERRTNRLARFYARLGVRPDSFVTIALPNGIAFFEATIAAWKLGATPQPISARLPTTERRAILELAAPALVVGVDPSEVADRPAVPARPGRQRSKSSRFRDPQIAHSGPRGSCRCGPRPGHL